jgi:hypothetical protein
VKLRTPSVLALCFALFELVTFFAPGTARASKCFELSLEQKLEAADVVFVGKALSQTAERDSVFVVERVFKGEVPKRITAHFFGVKYAMLFPPERYLVFGSIEPDTTSPGSPALLAVETCAGSLAVKYAADDLAKLGPGHAPGKALASGKSPGSSGNGDAGLATPAATGDAGARDAAFWDAAQSATPGADAPSGADAPGQPGPSAPAPIPSASDATAPPRQTSAAVPPDAGGCAGCRLGGDANRDAALLVWTVAAFALYGRRRS